MEHENELLDAWQGEPVMATLLGGSDLAFEDLSWAFRRPGFGIEEVRQAKTAVYELVEYDHLGVTFRRQEECAPRFFVPWGAVLGIQGADPEL